MSEGFNELELAILEWLKHTYADSRLTAQIESARFLKRDWTGTGFYVHFQVSEGVEKINLDDFEGRWPISGPNLASDDIQYGGGTLLWGADGYLGCLEMYAHGEFFNEAVHRFELSSRKSV